MQLREMAKTAPHATFAAQLLELADQYERLVERLDPTATSRTHRSGHPKKSYTAVRTATAGIWPLSLGQTGCSSRHQPNRDIGRTFISHFNRGLLAEGHGPQQEALLRLMEERRPIVQRY